MKLAVIIAGTFLIILFSWYLSLQYKRYHGIARFFAFESVFLLLILNYRVWFSDPFSFLQIVSWILLITSIWVVLAGYLLLKKKGNPGKNFEDTSVLVKSGIYGYIRHPLYLSIFMVGTGIMLKKPEGQQVLLAIVNLIAVYITAKIEEKEMIVKFGDSYYEYMKMTRMFIPYVL